MSRCIRKSDDHTLLDGAHNSKIPDGFLHESSSAVQVHIKIISMEECMHWNTTKYRKREVSLGKERDVCVMVSPNRQSHIVAKYGKSRNITPCSLSASTSWKKREQTKAMHSFS